MKLRIGRCRISVSFYFFALLAAAMLTGGGTMLLGMAAAGVHEAGHIAAALVLCRRAPVSFDVTPFGLRMGVISAGMTRRRSAAVAAGGAAANLLAAGAAWGMYAIFGGTALPLTAAAMLCLGAINLLPADPLDGGRILRLVLGSRLSLAATDKAMVLCSALSIFVLSAIGLYVLLRSRGNFSLLIVSIWLFVVLIRGYTYDI